MSLGSKVFVAGTADTKAAELRYVKRLIESEGVSAVLVDLSTGADDGAGDITAVDVAGHHPEGAGAVFTGDRGRSIAAMAVAFERFLVQRDDIAGIIGLGGSGGTALITPAMRALPVGVPKLMVSTVASGNVAPFVGGSDVAMMYSVTDLAGLNRISRVVLGNAARAIAAMARGRTDVQDGKPALGLTMFGVTTPCVTKVVAALEADFDCLVFHATGTGGQSMEKLAASDLLAGVLDVTTTEVCDFLVGGVFPCTEHRFGAFAGDGMPYVGSCGALDMVNFGAVETVPDRFRDRNLYVHNPQVTLMRVDADESARIGRWIGERLNAMEGEVRFLLPRGGVSALDAPGLPFHDPGADAALFEALAASLRQTERRRLIDLPHHINDPAFAASLAASLRDIVAHPGS